MDEIVKAVAKKAGIPEDAARIAVETTVNLLKDRLPTPIATQLDGALEGVKQEDVEQLADSIGGLLKRRRK